MNVLIVVVVWGNEMAFKNLREILEEHGVETTQEEREPIPDWQEPVRPPRRWLTLADLFVKGGNLISILAAIVQYCVAISIWLLIVLILLATLFGMLGWE